ncbi:hypothetical protein BDR06DRAFT_967667 [Suillus hirtellus]|nr:hypothetical protein BDR06DRAFT_967667 [Suillus hirtellus]
MTKRAEDAPYGTPSTHSRQICKVSWRYRENDENVPELYDESIEEDSEEEEFAPEEVTFEASEDSRFSSRGPADARAISLSHARQLQEAREQEKKNQSQPNKQPVSQKKTANPPRHVDPKRYG